MYLSLTHDAGGADGTATAPSRSSIADYRLTNRSEPPVFEANANRTTLVDKCTRSGNPPDGTVGINIAAYGSRLSSYGGVVCEIGRLARAVPQSVSAGLQLGLGLLDGRARAEADSRNPVDWIWLAGAAIRPDAHAALAGRADRARRRHYRRMGDRQGWDRVGGRHHAGHAAARHTELAGAFRSLCCRSSL